MGKAMKPWAVVVQQRVRGPWKIMRRCMTTEEARKYRWGPLIKYNRAAVIPVSGEEPLTHSEEAMLNGDPFRSRSVPVPADSSTPSVKLNHPATTKLSAMAGAVLAPIRWVWTLGRILVVYLQCIAALHSIVRTLRRRCSGTGSGTDA